MIVTVLIQNNNNNLNNFNNNNNHSIPIYKSRLTKAQKSKKKFQEIDKIERESL